MGDLLEGPALEHVQLDHPLVLVAQGGQGLRQRIVQLAQVGEHALPRRALVGHAIATTDFVELAEMPLPATTTLLGPGPPPRVGQLALGDRRHPTAERSAFLLGIELVHVGEHLQHDVLSQVVQTAIRRQVLPLQRLAHDDLHLLVQVGPGDVPVAVLLGSADVEEGALGGRAP